MTSRGKMAGLMVTAFVVGMFSPAVSAKTCVWTGLGTPDPTAGNNLVWTDSGNWEDGNVPQNGDTVVLVTKDAQMFRMNKSLTLENLYFTNTVGVTFNGKAQHVLTLTGADSVIVCKHADGFNLLTPINVAAGAKLTLNPVSGSINLKEPATFSGSGEIVKTGSSDYNVFMSSPGFSGTFTSREGAVKVMVASTAPLGDGSCIAHFWGTGLDLRYETTISNDVYLHDCHIVGYRPVTLNGNVTFVSETADNKVMYLEGAYGAKYYSADSQPAFVVNGKLKCDSTKFTARPQFYAYGSAATPLSNFSVTLNGGFEGWTRELGTTKKYAGDKVTICLNTPFITSNSSGILLYNTDRIVCGAKNVLQGKDVGFYTTSNIDNTDEVFDLNGYDQSIYRLLRSPKDGYRLEGSITSTRGPATLTTGAIYNGEGANRTIESLDGEVSLVLNKGNATKAGDVLFKGGTTTGWIVSDWAGCNLSQAAFPNLSGIGLKGAGIAYVGATTALKEGVKLDFNGRTTGYLRVETGTNIKAAQVVDGGVDVPAGVYCRVGAGIGGATEVAWLGGDGYNGTVTVAEHEASAIWTGAANDGDLANGDNWGSGTAPDLSDADVTVDFRYATAANPIILNGTVNLSAAMTCGDINQGRPTFGGTGTLVLGGSGTVTNTMAFVDQASLTWNGSGTLVLKDGASTSTGTLAVKAGEVVLAGDADWTGTVELDGQMELAGKSAYQVQALYLNGTLARYNKTYGSSASPAAIKDDVHFAGTGTILSMTKTGLMLLLR